MNWKSFLFGLSSVRLATAAIEAHNVLRNSPAEADSMLMTVWVDGQIVCVGAESIAVSSSESDWCLRNHDGKGSDCAPGYAYCTTDNGRRSKLEYFEDGALKHTFELQTRDWAFYEDPIACFTLERPNGEVEFFCSYWEACVSTSESNTCALCNEQRECDWGRKLNPPSPFPYPKPFKAMAVGDSMTHGNEGDFTWRYRLWEWMKDNPEYAVDMVGPWHGTMPRPGPESAWPEPPTIEGESSKIEKPNQGGKYHGDVPARFPDKHFARWGQQVHQSKDLVREFVKTHQPSHLLVMIGFNDLGWWVGDANQVIKDLKELVTEAQGAKSDIQIFISNVPHRSKIDGRDDLIEMTDDVNAQLGQVRSKFWDKGESIVRLVSVQQAYDCRPSGCPDGTDGLHPNPRGEFHIAKAFADALVDQGNISGDTLKIPSNIPTRIAPVPSNFQVTAVDIGLKLSWDRVFGVIRYETRARLKGQEWGTPLACSSNAWYRSWVLKDQEWEGQVRSVMADDVKSGWSSIKSAVMKPTTLPGPKNLVTRADGNQIKMSWDAVKGSVDRYGVVFYDEDGRDFIQIVGTRKTSYTIDGVNPGHRYFLAVETWDSRGGGWPTIGFGVVAGKGTPSLPTNFKVEAIDATTVRLSWSPSDNAAGYRVWLRNFNEGGNLEADPYGSGTKTSAEIYFLFPGVWNFEFCVSAYNGNQESPRTKVIKAPKP